MHVDISVPEWARFVVSDFTDMHRAPHAVDAGAVARFTLDLPDDVRFEYAFVDAAGQVRADPERGATGANPWYPEVTEVRGPAYTPHPIAEPPPAEPAWTVRRHKLPSRAFGTERRVVVASPPGARDPLPVVVLHDGVAFQRLARATDVLAAQVAAGKAKPAHLVYLEPGDRLEEYAWDERHGRFVHDEVRPLVAAHHATDGVWWAMGVSLGGLAAATLALEAPDAWTGVVAQGGAFLGTPADRRHHGAEASWLAERLEAGAGAHLRWVLDVGTLDWLHPVHGRVRAALTAHGAGVAYAERTAGHNWRCWRDGLADAFAAALPT
jgi:enterochelin esterase-like enzyme